MLHSSLPLANTRKLLIVVHVILLTPDVFILMRTIFFFDNHVFMHIAFSYREYILLTGPTKLSGNEVCKIGVRPSAKHEDRSQILQTEFPGNFVRLRSVRLFLHAGAEMGRKPGQETFVSCPGLSNNVGDTGQKF